ncbi:MAG: NfeD family protein, partial [Alphaproteobacteria bacterium]|nr:NfeD family protein [Alphaproteobacteria bacterium]
MDYISFWHWLILATILIGLESLAPLAYLMWFGIAAIFQSILTYLFIENPMIQIFSYSILAFLVTIFGRRFIPIHVEQKNQRNMNKRLESMIGKIVILDNPIINGQTQLTIDASIWKATGPD